MSIADSRIIVDIRASKGFAHYTVNGMPTITSTRAVARAWWVADLGRQISTKEILFLQGFEADAIDYKSAGVSDQRIYHMTGNAMSANILERLLPKVLDAVGIFPSSPNLDRSLHATRACLPPVTPPAMRVSPMDWKSHVRTFLAL